ncbi:transglutaminase TgpA family protein [Cerasibacillus sp. JNUCC 74]
MNQPKQHLPNFYTFILYICGFLLFLEWLYPLKQLTDTSHLTIFIIYGVFCFLLSALEIKWGLSFILKGSALLLVLNSLFFEFAFINPIWLEQLFHDTMANLTALSTQAWHEFTPMFRSLLFLLLIWLMSYLLHYWLVMMKRIFLFVLLTFAYLTVLDTFTVYNGNSAIIRTFIISLLAMGIANFLKELDRESLTSTLLRKTPFWIIPLIAVILFSSAVGLAAPKFDPKWPDPVPFIQSSAENAGLVESDGKSGVQKVGYGEDDTRLGGSFVQDYTPVFRAEAEEEHYWRVETKDFYTGKGWESSQAENYADFLKVPPMYPKTVETRRMRASIEFQGKEALDKLVHPYGIDDFSEVAGDPYIDLATEAIQLRDEDYKPIKQNSYTLSYDYPTFNIGDLRKAPFTGGADDAFTQLPDSLPDRVVELAKKITKDEKSRYDKAKAVESYFSRNGFTYQTTDVPVPKKEQDYVDQFLFESQVGYCDNFSTSMVVLLRALDIPARWAKGFTSGEMVDSSNETNIYEITNANAHSWVEVYFPGSGWVPFEPTKGFSNLADFQTTMTNNGAEQDQAKQEDKEQPEQNTEQPPNEKEEAEQDTVAAKTDKKSNGTGTSIWTWVAISLAAFMGICIYIAYRTRFRWYTAWLSRKFTANWNANNYQEAYHYLMKLLQKHGEPKQPGETLREYAKKIDEKYQTNEMQQLTKQYEQFIYRSDYNETPKLEIAQLWQNLIKRILT